MWAGRGEPLSPQQQGAVHAQAPEAAADSVFGLSTSDFRSPGLGTLGDLRRERSESKPEEKKRARERALGGDAPQARSD